MYVCVCVCVCVCGCVCVCDKNIRSSPPLLIYFDKKAPMHGGRCAKNNFIVEEPTDHLGQQHDDSTHAIDQSIQVAIRIVLDVAFFSSWVVLIESKHEVS